MNPLDILTIGSTLLDRVLPNPKDAAEAKLKLLELQQNGDLARWQGEVTMAQGQVSTNTAEAASASLWVAGWRPAVGWTCATAFAFKFVLGPLASVVMQALGHPIVLPVLDYSEMSTILIGMLGLGVTRSWEKIKGVSQ